MLTKDRIAELLQEQNTYLASEFGVHRIGLFGSASRNLSGDASDIDLVLLHDGRRPAARAEHHPLERFAGPHVALDDGTRRRARFHAGDAHVVLLDAPERGEQGVRHARNAGIGQHPSHRRAHHRVRGHAPQARCGGQRPAIEACLSLIHI